MHDLSVSLRNIGAVEKAEASALSLARVARRCSHRVFDFTSCAGFSGPDFGEPARLLHPQRGRASILPLQLLHQWEGNSPSLSEGSVPSFKAPVP